MRKFGKKVLHSYGTVWNGDWIECFILQNKDNEYIDIHIIHPSFRSDEMNTLQLQEPVEFAKDYLNDIKCDCMIAEFILWYKHSTNDRVLSFSVEKYEDGE